MKTIQDLEAETEHLDGWNVETDPLRLYPTISGDLRVEYCTAYYFLERFGIDDLLRFGRYTKLQWHCKDIPETICMRHPNGSAIVIRLREGVDFIIPKPQFEQVYRAEIPELIVAPCKRDN